MRSTSHENELPIVDSEIDGNLIYYVLPDGHNLKLGDVVSMKIDWPRRYRLMRLHFAAELVLELVTQELKLEKIGAHIAETKARIAEAQEKQINIPLEFLNYINEQLKLLSEKAIASLLVQKCAVDFVVERASCSFYLTSDLRYTHIFNHKFKANHLFISIFST